MNEAEWLTCDSPVKMLDWLRGTASARKLRLFATLVNHHRVLRRYTPQEYARALKEGSLPDFGVAERFADGEATEAELTRVYAAAATAAAAAQAAADEADEDARTATVGMDQADLRAAMAGQAASKIRLDAAVFNPDAFEAAREMALTSSEYRNLDVCELIREVFGNPTRPVAVEPTWLAWNDGTVTRIAQEIYGGLAFDRLPILADALEEAGCVEQALLSHLRGPGGYVRGKHPRGCWALDLLLGRK